MSHPLEGNQYWMLLWKPSSLQRECVHHGSSTEHEDGTLWFSKMLLLIVKVKHSAVKYVFRWKMIFKAKIMFRPWSSSLSDSRVSRISTLLVLRQPASPWSWSIPTALWTQLRTRAVVSRTFSQLFREHKEKKR